MEKNVHPIFVNILEVLMPPEQEEPTPVVKVNEDVES